MVTLGVRASTSRFGGDTVLSTTLGMIKIHDITPTSCQLPCLLPSSSCHHDLAVFPHSLPMAALINLIQTGLLREIMTQSAQCEYSSSQVALEFLQGTVTYTLRYAFGISGPVEALVVSFSTSHMTEIIFKENTSCPPLPKPQLSLGRGRTS